MDYENVKPCFAWLPIEVIKETFKNSAQYGHMPASSQGNLLNRFKAPNPEMSVLLLNEDTLTDSVYSDTPAIDYGHKLAQIYCGSHVDALGDKVSNTPCVWDFEDESPVHAVDCRDR